MALISQGHFSSVIMARCFPRTNVSWCVRLRALNRTVPAVKEFTTVCPSGIVDWRLVARISIISPSRE